ncbi:hypothetical protein INS49_007859 [Diaporthe citri]|uniref:uncharacterized protein n=1 Tax=Diaporthe citri TaxID=83186 RepID=UPI001C8160F5|nr:uncharacterized protein INS49_007859 [Diaporthe citri]KAG6362765.1 hypothetical protein INS49_007859 [Diaporthe citri]
MAQQQQQQQHGGTDIGAADNDFLPVLTPETTQEPAAQDTTTSTTRPGDAHHAPKPVQGSTRVAEADADADKISAGFSAGSLAQTIGLPAPRLPGGQDAQLLTENKSTFVDTRYLLATADAEPAHIMVRTEGWRTGPPEVLTRLLDPVEGDKVSPDEYRFRIFIRLETGDERYRWVNEGMWIGSGVRRGLEVIYDGYRLL